MLIRLAVSATDASLQRTVTSPAPYTAPPVYDAFPPPVPPLPKEHREHRGDSARSFDTDVFSSPSSSMDLHKPLPDIVQIGRAHV